MSASVWKQHFKDMMEGKIKPDRSGTWRVKDYGAQQQQQQQRKEFESPVIKVVSPTQQAVDQARSKRRPSRRITSAQNKPRKKKRPTSWNGAVLMKRATTSNKKSRRGVRGANTWSTTRKKKDAVVKQRRGSKKTQSCPRQQAKYTDRPRQLSPLWPATPTVYPIGQPIGQLSSDGALEFNISGNSHKYVDLANTRLQIKFRIVQGDRQLLPAVKGTDDPDRPKANVGPVNLFLQSLWRQVDVFLEQQAISPNVSTKYPYKAYIEALLNYSMNAKESQLQSQLYYKDNELPNSTDNDPLDSGNMGLYTRTRMTNQSAIVDLEGPVYNDICMQSRYILNGVQVGFKFWPSSNQFKLMSLSKSDDFKVEIKEAVLKVCMIEVSPEIVIAHAETLQYGAAKYLYQRTDMKSFAIAKGQYSCCVEDIYQGEVPNRVVVGFVTSEAFMGSYEKNPFNFQTFDLSFAGFYIDGRSMPAEPLTPNYKAGNYLSAYMTTFEENYQKNFGHYITRADYIRGNVFTSLIYVRTIVKGSLSM